MPLRNMKLNHRYLREIDRSLDVVGGLAAILAMTLHPGANQYTEPTYSVKVCFMVAFDITTTVNKGRQAWPMRGLLL